MLEFVPANLQTQEICVAAVINHRDALEFVREEFKEACEAAILANDDVDNDVDENDEV
jgi:hypothetical protein